ncbi:MAG: methyltransferase [Chitinivibrionales bacterium]|nr:methyltransferase [Chitinivibrionales bacterium]
MNAYRGPTSNVGRGPRAGETISPILRHSARQERGAFGPQPQPLPNSRQTRHVVLTIDKIVHGGLGLAYAERGAVFVSDSIPGERIQAEVVGNRARCAFARPTELIEPSPDRRQPFCPYAALCGGCDWQHIAYGRQVALKREILLDCLRRQGRLELVPPVEEFRSAETRYRIRAQFKVAPDGDAVGFYRRGSNDIVALDACPLLAEPLEHFLTRLTAAGPTLGLSVRQVKAIAGTGDSIASSPTIPGLSSPGARIEVGGRTFEVRGDSFFQGNRYLLEKLGRWAEDKLPGGECVDLYGGVGFFSIMLSRCFSRIRLVEAEPSLVRLARRNFAANGLDHCTAESAQAERYAASATQGPDCLIVDPPRQGLTRAVREGIARLRPRAVLYVACDPATQARDVGELVRNHGYVFTHCALFDLYPNTHHLESAVVLARRGP